MNETMRRQHLRHLSGVGVLCLVLVFVGACGREKPAPNAGEMANAPRSAAFKPLAVGDLMPAYSTVSLKGDTLKFGNGDGAGLTILNVWATWCASCREEMADLEALHREFNPKGVRIVGVSVDEASTERVRGYVANEKLTFTIAHDQDGIVQRAYQISGIPQTFVIGSDGILLWKTTGNLHGVVDSLKNVLHRAAAPK